VLGVVRLEVPRLVGQQCVGRGVRLVETVPGEEFNELEDLRGLLLGDATLGAPGHESKAGGLHLLFVFFTHGAAQFVRLPQGEAGQVAGQPHDLLLIRDDAVGLFEDRLHLRQFVLDLDAAMFPVDVVVNNAATQRSGPVQRVEGDQVFQALRLRFPQRLAHARAFKLEHAVCLAVGKQLIRLRVVHRQMVEVHHIAGGFLDVLDGIIQQRQGAQTEEVHLEQAHPLDVLHGPLGRDFVLLAAIERSELHHLPWRNDDARGVHRRVPRHPFQAPGHLQQFAHALVLAFKVGQRGHLLDRLVEAHVERAGNQLGHAVNFGDRELHHAPDVADHGASLHGAERDDLRHVFAAVLLRDVLDHFGAPPLAEVDIDIRQRDALGVQEPFEVQVEVQRIDIRDPHAIRHQAAGGGPAARSDRNAAFTGVANEVPDDQEVPVVLHLPDHVEFVLQPRLVLGKRPAQFTARFHLAPAHHPFLEPLTRDVLEVRAGREPGRHIEVGKMIDVLGNIDRAPLRDSQRIGQRFGLVTEHRGHLLGGFQEKLIPVIFEALFVADVLARADAQQDVVRVLIGVLEVVHVIGGHQRQPEFSCDGQQAGVDDALLFDALVLHLEKEVLRSQDVAIACRCVHRLARLVCADTRRHLTLETTAEPDEPLRVLGEQGVVDSGLVVEPLGVAR